MKILKLPDHVIFDTDNPDKMEFKPSPIFIASSLHQVTSNTDWDFLSDHFKPVDGVGHPIFKDFGKSFFYVLEV